MSRSAHVTRFLRTTDCHPGALPFAVMTQFSTGAAHRTLPISSRSLIHHYNDLETELEEDQADTGTRAAQSETDNASMKQYALAEARGLALFQSHRKMPWQRPELTDADQNALEAMQQEIGRRSLTDFDRDVYCLLGIPIDAVDMAEVLRQVHAAANNKHRCFLSTPNLNFLIGCQENVAFRESLINSDLSIVDGLPLAWMARRLGIPLRKRVTGSGLFEALMTVSPDSTRRLKVYFFGGREDAAETACRKLNAVDCGLTCTGWHYPGYGSVEALSEQAKIDHINASKPDFLVVSLGARKGQAWIEANLGRLAVPVISHLGAVVNFVAGTVLRAPAWVQRFGMEWLWRIKEEPALWKRYWLDGVSMLKLMVTRLLPQMIYLALRRFANDGETSDANACLQESASGESRIVISGAIPDCVPSQIREVLRDATLLQTHLVVDLSQARHLSPAMFGLLLILRKHQNAVGKKVAFQGLSRRMRQLFFWNGVSYLLADPAPHVSSAAIDQKVQQATSL